MVRSYLSEVRRHLHLDAGTEQRVMSELATHFQDKVGDLRREGLDDQEAAEKAISSFGGARDVARLMDEAYGRGSWVDALVSCQPHLLVASLFATHLWRHPALLVVCFGLIAATAILGWRAGSPTWTFSWAGYAFFPPLILAYLCRGVPSDALASLASGAAPLANAAKLAAVALLYGFTSWALLSAIIRVSRRDWILVSLMLLPLVVLGIWACTVERTGDLFVGVLGGAPQAHGLWDRAMACLCTVLGLTAAAFVRMRARLLKGVAVVAMGIVSGALLVRSLHGGDLGFAPFLTVCLGLFLVLMSPLLIHALVARADAAAERAEEARAS